MAQSLETGSTYQDLSRDGNHLQIVPNVVEKDCKKMSQRCLTDKSSTKLVPLCVL